MAVRCGVDSRSVVTKMMPCSFLGLFPLLLALLSRETSFRSFGSSYTNLSRFIGSCSPRPRELCLDGLDRHVVVVDQRGRDRMQVVGVIRSHGALDGGRHPVGLHRFW